MSGRLYKATLEYVVFVIAENEHDAIEIARAVTDDEEPGFSDAILVNKTDPIPAPWVNSLPYGGTDDTETVGKIMESL